MKTNLLRRITELPQVIQDIISEFNVEHRKYTRKLNKEYFTIISKKCVNCNIFCSKDVFWSIDYFIYKKYNMNSYWCSDICYNTENNEILKEKYIESIEDYLHNKSRQFHNQSIQL